MGYHLDEAIHTRRVSVTALSRPRSLPVYLADGLFCGQCCLPGRSLCACVVADAGLARMALGKDCASRHVCGADLGESLCAVFDPRQWRCYLRDRESSRMVRGRTLRAPPCMHPARADVARHPQGPTDQSTAEAGHGRGRDLSGSGVALVDRVADLLRLDLGL